MIAKFTVFKARAFEWKGTNYQELTLLDDSAVPIEQMCKYSCPEEKAPVKTAELKGKKITLNIERIDVRDGSPSFRGQYELAAK